MFVEALKNNIIHYQANNLTADMFVIIIYCTVMKNKWN